MAHYSRHSSWLLRMYCLVTDDGPVSDTLAIPATGHHITSPAHATAAAAKEKKLGHRRVDETGIVTYKKVNEILD